MFRTRAFPLKVAYILETNPRLLCFAIPESDCSIKLLHSVQNRPVSYHFTGPVGHHIPIGKRDNTDDVTEQAAYRKRRR